MLVQHVHAGFRRAVESPEWKVRKAVVLLVRSEGLCH